jgi:hypothetical protein
MLCTYQALRRLITRTALEADLDPARISFPKALDSSTGRRGADVPCAGRPA